MSFAASHRCRRRITPGGPRRDHALPNERIDQRRLEVPECRGVDSNQLSDFRAAVRHGEVPPMNVSTKGLRPPQAAARSWLDPWLLLVSGDAPILRRWGR